MWAGLMGGAAGAAGGAAGGGSILGQVLASLFGSGRKKQPGDLASALGSIRTDPLTARTSPAQAGAGVTILPRERNKTAETLAGVADLLRGLNPGGRIISNYFGGQGR